MAVVGKGSIKLGTKSDIYKSVIISSINNVYVVYDLISCLLIFLLSSDLSSDVRTDWKCSLYMLKPQKGVHSLYFSLTPA